MLKRVVAWSTGAVLFFLTLLWAITAFAAESILVLGTRNEEVTEIQRALNQLGYLNQSPTGYFGENTRAAVIAFQKDKGLTQDGKVGSQTKSQLLASNQKVKAASSTSVYTVGARGNEVTAIQKTLYQLKYLKQKPTGYFGIATRDAVRAFQKKANLAVDGKVGPKTRSALNKAAAGSSGQTGEPSEKEPSVTSGILRYGSTGSQVTEIQQILYDKKYLKQKPTGFFGTNTQAAVIAFQKDNKLVADGLVGAKTKAALSSSTGGAGDDKQTEDEIFPVKPGDRGEIVTRIQTQLKKLSYYTYQSVTEFYGPITKEAVMKFQKKSGLQATGIVDKATYDKMFAKQAEANQLAVGDKGDDVTKLQNRLKKLGYFDSAATGYFGSITKAAVTQFQKVNGLKQTGVASDETTKLLYSDAAKKNKGEEDKPSSPPSATPEKTPGATALPTAPASDKPVSSDAEKFVDTLEQLVGAKYVYSTEGPDTFDCSGLVYYALRQCGVSVARKSSASFAAEAQWTEITSLAKVQKGDLLFFKSDSSDRISHMSVYVGDNQQIHAVTSAGKVVQQDVSAYYVRNFVCARRVFA